mmetsp:Transcript_16152/g.50784  ORF Transcript_16152/g.50784 Transcript_16152/m.50784 type:complete len:308 (-) Transcript_16152:2754-3677(-)
MQKMVLLLEILQLGLQLCLLPIQLGALRLPLQCGLRLGALRIGGLGEGVADLRLGSAGAALHLVELLEALAVCNDLALVRILGRPPLHVLRLHVALERGHARLDLRHAAVGGGRAVLDRRELALHLLHANLAGLLLPLEGRLGIRPGLGGHLKLRARHLLRLLRTLDRGLGLGFELVVGLRDGLEGLVIGGSDGLVLGSMPSGGGGLLLGGCKLLLHRLKSRLELDDALLASGWSAARRRNPDSCTSSRAGDTRAHPLHSKRQALLALRQLCLQRRGFGFGSVGAFGGRGFGLLSSSKIFLGGSELG